MSEVQIPAGSATLDGNLTTVDQTEAFVLFAHGSGSSRHSPRNQFVARTLNEAGLATLLFDLLTPEEVGAVVSRGGRPDLAGQALPKVKAPTLLIVGGEDHVVIELNEQARAQMKCECKIEIVPGATHLFEEPGALEEVAKLASDWFVKHIGG